MSIHLTVDIGEKLNKVLNIFSTFNVVDLITCIVEILVIAFAIYHILLWVKNSRAWTLLRGVILILLLVIIAEIFNLDVLIYIFQRLGWFAIIALIIIFQSDLRVGLEKLGRQSFFAKLLPDINKLTKKTSGSIVQDIAEAAFDMASVKTGALIVVEQSDSLEGIEKTGIKINGVVSKQLLINIFEKNTPLHDGAVLIVGDTVKAATCYLPLSQNMRISKDLGTRHRAGLGVSEISDSQTIVVSEQTGRVSLCSNGEIIVMHDEKELKKTLIDTIYSDEIEENNNKSLIKTVKGWFVYGK